jgi:glycosyltransferase involved in cell wall biosynthesis
METYSVEVCRELGTLVSLTVRALPGQRSGYPPHAAQLTFFFLSTAFYILFRSRRFQVVHCGDLVLFPLAWLHWFRHPNRARVITVHGLDLLYGNRPGLAPRLYRLFVTWITGQHRAVCTYLANSRNTAHIASDLGLTPTRAIPLGVRLRDPLPAIEEPRRPLYLLYAGRLVPRKGAAWFAENVLPGLPDTIELHVVGKSWDDEELHRLKHAPRTRLLGFLSDSDLSEQRRRCLAIVMPNRPSENATDVEGFGIAALEAAREGVPVLASAIEGLTDAVIDQKTGFLLPPGDASAWQRVILQIAQWGTAARKAFGAQARDLVRQRYSWHRVALDTVECYRNCQSMHHQPDDIRPTAERSDNR